MAAGSPCAAVPAKEESIFGSKQLMIQHAGRLGLVQLVFASTLGRPVLFAHSSYLIASSGTLRNQLEDQDAVYHDQPAKIARSDSSADKADALMKTITLYDDDTRAWECFLGMLYPETTLNAKVTWKNMQRLLLLADKYDVPMVFGRVRAFLDKGGKKFVKTAKPSKKSSSSKTKSSVVIRGTRLECYLTAENAFNWLQLFSRFGMDSHVKCCINYIVNKNLRIKDGYLSGGIQHQHIEQLLQAVLGDYNIKMSCMSRTISDVGGKLEIAEKQLELLGNVQQQQYESAICNKCKAPWYWLLNKKKETPVCINCGALKRSGYQSSS